MPYTWSDPQPGAQHLRLWPHNSLPPEGFAAMVLGFFLFATIPLYWLIGTAVFWGLLPFVMLAVGALYWALSRNARDRRIVEELDLAPDQTRLIRTNPEGDVQEWRATTHWVRITMHKTGGPVPHYVTLTGEGREVEIGAFLSEEERVALYEELVSCLAGVRSATGGA